MFDGATGTLLQSFLAFDGEFVGGVRVAGGDIDRDGRDDIIIGAGPGAGSHVKVFDGDDLRLLYSRIIYEPGYRGGVSVHISDLSGRGLDDVVVERNTGELRGFYDNGVDGSARDFAGTGSGSGTGTGTGTGTGSGSGDGSGSGSGG